MTKKLTFSEVSDQASRLGFTLVKYAGSTNAYGSVYRCSEGHTWSAKHNNVVSSNKTGCPTCSAGKTRLTKPDIEAALASLNFTLHELHGEIRGAQTEVTTSCVNGHLRKGKLGTVIHAKKPCPDCSRAARKVDLAGINSRLAEKGYSLLSWQESTRKEGEFACTCGQSWTARVNSVLQGQSNCPGCYEGGLRGDMPAVFYIYELRKQSRLRYGYGISGAFSRRDSEHRRNASEGGWKIKLIKVVEFDVGAEAVRLEKMVKSRFKPPTGMLKGFKTESIMPKHLSELIALSDSL